METAQEYSLPALMAASLQVAELDIYRQSREARENSRELNVQLVSLKGKILTCSYYSRQEAVKKQFAPGMFVKVISEDYDIETGNSKTSIVQGRVQSCTLQEGQPVIKIELLEKGEIYKKDMKLVPRVQMVALVKYSGLLLEAAGNRDKMTVPAKAFLEARFGEKPLDGEVPESRDDLDECQNEAFGRAMRFEKEPVLFIHGGPGSGKTRTLCSIVEGHVSQGRRVLVLSHSNRGAQVPALMLKKNHPHFNLYVAGSNPDVVDRKLHENRIKRGIKFPTEQLRGVHEEAAAEARDAQREAREHIPGYDLFNPRTEPRIDLQKIEERLRRGVLHVHAIEIAHAKQKLMKKLERGGAVFSTFGTLINDETLEGVDFDVVTVDEATRMRMPDLLLALARSGKQIILVGDPMQLGNIPLEPKERSKLGECLPVDIIGETRNKVLHAYEIGAFASAIKSTKDPEKDLPYVFLKNNRRSRRSIVEVLSGLIYGGKLVPARETAETDPKGVVEFIDTSVINAREKTTGTSKRNPKEADVVVKKVLDKILGKGVRPEEIAVIATYSEQAGLIRRKLSRFLFDRKDILECLLKNVDSVDAFQGSERRIVFVSLTRSNEQGAVGFLKEEERIGVAVGRAQDELYIVGDLSTLVEENSDAESREFFGDMKELVGRHGQVLKEPYKSPRKRRK